MKLEKVITINPIDKTQLKVLLVNTTQSAYIGS